MSYDRRLARKIARTLFAGQSLGSAGFIAAATVNAIVGARLAGQAAWAGVPSAIYLLGSALAAFVWGSASDRLGRRRGLVLGLLLGMLGAALAATAVVVNAFGILLAGLALMGTAHAALQLSRFAAAEVHPPAERGRAISTVVMGGALGSVFGPLLVGPVGRAAHTAGIDELAGPYAASVVLFLFAAIVVFVWLRPDPRDIGRDLAQRTGAVSLGPARSLAELFRVPAIILAMGAMICGQLTMVMLMVISGVHLQAHHHPLPSISLVIAAHTFGMYGFSVLSGRLSDQLGRVPVVVIGALALIVAGLLAPLSPALGPMAASLFLLGLGWNFCFVGGSSLLADQLSPAERARTQGINDLLIGLVSAMGSLGSGLVFATVGFTLMSGFSALIALVPVVLAAWLRRGRSLVVPAP